MTKKQVTIRQWVESMRNNPHKYLQGKLSDGNGNHCALGMLCEELEMIEIQPGYYSSTSGFNPDELAAGDSVGRTLDSQLKANGINPRSIALRNDIHESYDNVITYITCASGADPDAVIEIEVEDA